MTNSLDFHFHPISRQPGSETAGLPGLWIQTAPRRAARSRSDDSLILYCTQEGSGLLDAPHLEQALKQCARTYFDTSGSATGALRAAAETINRAFLERNLSQASSGRQINAGIVMFARRGNQIYGALTGKMQVFWIRSGQVEHWADPEAVPRGLGMGRVVAVRFFQVEMQAKDTVLITAHPAAHWQPASLAGLYGVGLEGIRRRFLQNTPADFEAVLAQAKPGPGKTDLLRSTPPAPAEAGSVAPETSTVTKTAEKPSFRMFSPARKAAVPAEEAAEDSEPASPAAPAQAETSSATVAPLPTPAPEFASAPALPETPKEKGPGLGAVVAKVLRPLAQAGDALGKTLRTLLLRMLPGDALDGLPSTTMALIAIIVPIVMVSMASVVYFQRGRAVQYELLFNQAIESATQADSETDLLNRRTAWRTTLDYLEQAENYQVTESSQELRTRILRALDDIDLIRRPDFQPAIIGGLPEPVNITRMVISDNDLYLLDATSGAVLRGLVTLRGYEIDNTFQCGGGGSEPIIDMAAWPVENSPAAAVLAMDAAGNLYYCNPGEPAHEVALIPPQTLEWGNLTGFALDLGNVYVLDTRANTVWIYWNSAEPIEPESFFGAQAPDLSDVVDLTVNNSELYLLHATGQMTVCYYSDLQVSPTRCADQAYVDLRPGRENTPLVPPDPFTQVMNTPPPDPSLYFLEGKDQAIYHFSLRNLAFQRQYLPLATLSTGPASAFTVDTVNRTFYIAFGNDVFYANIP